MTHTIKLIAIDLDGTLLNSDHEVTPRTEQAIRRAMARGVQVVIATGRPRYTAEKYLTRLGLNAPGVFMQGLTIFDGDGTLLHEEHLPPDVAREVLGFAEENDHSAMVYNSRSIVTRSRNAQTDTMLRYGEPVPKIMPNIRDLPDLIPICKVLIVDDPPRIPSIRAALAARIDGSATIITSAAHLLETLPLGASKGAGLLRLLRYLSIAPEQVMAIGDAENDLEMLEWVGLGVAMGNASEQVKGVADQVVGSNNEDGVAEAIERFVLMDV